jgi:gas vesicle protein
MSTKEFIIGATIGSLLGSASAFLLAPKTGKKMRRDISDLYDELFEKTQDLACMISKKGKCLVNDASGQSDWTSKAKSLMSDLADRINFFKKEEAQDTCQVKEFVIGAVAGGLIGALAGLLLAPKPGDKFRDDIMDTYNDVTDKTQDFANHVQKQGKYMAKNARKKANKWLDLAKNMVNEFVDDAEEINENVTEKVKDFADMGRDRLGPILEWAALGLRVIKSFNKGK